MANNRLKEVQIKVNIQHVPRKNLVLPEDPVARQKQLFEYASATQKIDADLDICQPEVTVDFKTNDPVQIVHLSDLHIGHFATSHDLINHFLDYVRTTPNCYVIFYGDLLEGYKAEYADTSASQTVWDAGKQMAVLDVILQDLVAHNKLIAAVGGYHGHDMWPMEQSTVDLYDKDYLRGKVVETDGKINLRFPDGEVETILAYHDPGAGGSDFNPLGSQRAKLQNRTGDNVFGGHYHSRGGVAADVDTSGRVVNLAATATFKGLAEFIQHDRLLRDKAVRSCPPGVATTHLHDGGESDRLTYITADLDRAKTLLSSENFVCQVEELFNEATRQKAVEELAVEMEKMVGGKSHIKFERYGPGASRIRKTDEFAGKATKHWKELAYTFLDTVLPVQLYFVAHYRAGSKTSDEKQLQEILNEVRTSNHAYVCFLRQMVDQDLAKDNDREVEVFEMLGQIKDLYGPLVNGDSGVRPKVLAWMYDGALRNEGWKTARPEYKMNQDGKWRVVTYKDKEGNERIQKEGFYAASVIENDRKVPLIDNKGELKLAFFDGPKYRLYLLDALGRSASVDNPQQGLRRMELRHSKQNEPHDLIVGGNMPIASVAMLYDHKLKTHQGYISPGHLAEWMGFGKQNMSEASPGGQSAIFLPDKKMFFLGANLDQSKQLFQALTIFQGALHDHGVDYWLDRLGKRKKIISHRKK